MFKKNDTVFYTSGRDIVRAKVLVAHRDGSAKVQAQFFVREGRDQGVFIGYEYELDGAFIYPNEMTADQAIIRMLTKRAA